MFGQRGPTETKLHGADGQSYARPPRHHAALPGSLQALPRRRLISNTHVCAITWPCTHPPGRTLTGFVPYSSRGSSSVASSSYSDRDDADENENFVNIWEPVPPTLALGRKRKIALMVAAACLELSLTGAQETVVIGKQLTRHRQRLCISKQKFCTCQQQLQCIMFCICLP